MSKLRQEQERFNTMWKRVSILLKQHPKRYLNKTDVLEEALDDLEKKIARETENWNTYGA